MSRQTLIGVLMALIILQALAILWLVRTQLGSIDATWNRYHSGKRQLLEGILIDDPEQARRGANQMDAAFDRLRAADEIVAVSVPQHGELVQTLTDMGISDQCSGAQAMGGQRPTGSDGSRTMYINICEYRLLQKDHPTLLPQR